MKPRYFTYFFSQHTFFQLLLFSFFLRFWFGQEILFFFLFSLLSDSSYFTSNLTFFLISCKLFLDSFFTLLSCGHQCETETFENNSNIQESLHTNYPVFDLLALLSFPLEFQSCFIVLFHFCKSQTVLWFPQYLLQFNWVSHPRNDRFYLHLIWIDWRIGD